MAASPSPSPSALGYSHNPAISFRAAAAAAAGRLNFPSPRRRPLRVESLRSTDGSTRVSVAVEDEEGDAIRRLQNGPDVRGVAIEGERGRAVDLTPPAVEAIAESFGEWVTEDLQKEQGGAAKVRVSIGRDPRISGPKLSDVLSAGLARAGCEVFDMGLATTPACFMSTVLAPFEYDASVMMTASHLPYTRNGLKFFTKRGGLTASEMEAICERAARKHVMRKLGLGGGGGRGGGWSPVPPVSRVDFMSAYAQHLRNIIIERASHPEHYHTPLKGFKVIVNAGNGSGGFFTWNVLDKLGADTFGSLNLQPDGMFPNHIPNPEDPTAMALTRAAVLEHGADLGIVFDTDVDRSGVVDGTGAAINGDRLIALMSAIVLREHPGCTVVTDARTSVALTKFITEKGGRHCLYRVGYRNVIDKGIQLNEDGIETQLMMETTGHGALKENYFLDDGAYMVVKILIEMVRMKLAGSGEGIGSLIKELEEPVESVELRMDIVTQPKYAKEKGSEAVETLRKYIEDGQLEGWELDTCGDCWVSEGCLVDSNDSPFAIDAHMYRARVSDEVRGQHGWIHFRQSVHNPTIALNMQSSVAGGCQEMTRVLLHKFFLASSLDKILDISQIKAYASKGRLG